jgi:hypothetical protein
MDNLINNELELRKWALEISLKHGNALFPQKHVKSPSEILSNAHRIITLITSGWDEPIQDCINLEYDYELFQRNP